MCAYARVCACAWVRVCVCPSNDILMRKGEERIIKTSCTQVRFRRWTLSNTNFLWCSDSTISSAEFDTFLRTMICPYFSFVMILDECHPLSHDHSLSSVPTCRTRVMEAIFSTGFFIFMELIDIKHLENSSRTGNKIILWLPGKSRLSKV